jgi:glycine dehydrogenase subunit 2
MTKTIFELGMPGRKAVSLPECDTPDYMEHLPEKYLRKKPAELPEVSEPDIIRHYTNLSMKNFGVDANFYPLGSCTMKYNPKINEEMAALPGFSSVHPLQPEETVQGCLELMYRLEALLCEIAGMDAFSLQPAAGAQGEITGLMIMRKYLDDHGLGHKNIILVPDSSHGTNPASAALAGFEVQTVPSNEKGLTDMEQLKAMINDKVAGLMLTNPNTVGVFEENIEEIADLIHGVNGLLYYDGANANAIVGIARAGDMGFDLVHFNLHKTFSTPHGGGGPGAGPIGVKKHLADYLPVPVVRKDKERYYLEYDLPSYIGKIHSFYGNFGVQVKAYCYILTMGQEGLVQVAKNAVLNANYAAKKLGEFLKIPYNKGIMHEFIVSFDTLLDKGVTARDAAKRLIDFGIHPPTMYFPAIVPEALMIEPTETESKETLDRFCQTMKQILEEGLHDPDQLKTAPHTKSVKRLDEVTAARNPIIKYEP